MSRALLGRIKKLEQAMIPSPEPDKARLWRDTLLYAAKGYGTQEEQDAVRAMTDEQVRAEWLRMDAQLSAIYAMSDEELEAYLAEDGPEERAKLAATPTSELQAIVTAYGRTPPAH